jgi:hypothetical protein
LTRLGLPLSPVLIPVFFLIVATSSLPVLLASLITVSFCVSNAVADNGLDGLNGVSETTSALFWSSAQKLQIEYPFEVK